MFVLDPKQLPPVPDKMIFDDGHFCFESYLWTNTFKHHVHLTKNFRNTDADLSRLVEAVFEGPPSLEVCEYASSLTRPLQPEQMNDVTHLYGTNYECNLHNSRQLQTLEGQAVTFVAEDEGNIAKIDSHRVPSKLLLKVCS